MYEFTHFVFQANILLIHLFASFLRCAPIVTLGLWFVAVEEDPSKTTNTK